MAAGVERHLVELRRKEIPAGEVRAAVYLQQAQRKRAGLSNPIGRVLIRERHICQFCLITQFAEYLRGLALGPGAKAILGELAEGEVVVNWAVRSARVQTVTFAAEASRRRFGFN